MPFLSPDEQRRLEEAIAEEWRSRFWAVSKPKQTIEFSEPCDPNVWIPEPWPFPISKKDRAFLQSIHVRPD